MRFPFSVEEFFAVFRAYNEAVWPAQWGLLILGLVALLGPALRNPVWSRVSYAVLAVLWAWMAVVYQWTFFSTVNPMAPAFAILFVAGAVGFALRAARTPPPRLAWQPGARSVVGALLILYGLVLYAILGAAFGHRYPDAPAFGLPCPTTIFTIGLLTFAVPAPGPSLLLVPLLWSIVGSTAALSLGVPQDYGLAVAGAWAVYLIIASRP